MCPGCIKMVLSVANEALDKLDEEAIQMCSTRPRTLLLWNEIEQHDCNICVDWLKGRRKYWMLLKLSMNLSSMLHDRPNCTDPIKVQVAIRDAYSKIDTRLKES
jgi:hypothetical protein